MAFILPLALSTVNTEYGNTGNNLAGLSGKVFYTSGTTGGVSTGTSVSLPVSLASFSGKFISSIGILADQSNQTTAFGAANTVTCNVGFNTVSYTVRNGKITSLTLTFTQGNSYGGSAISSGNNSFGASVSVDGVVTSCSSGTNNITGLNGQTSLVIYVTAQASNNLGIQTRATVNCVYSITPTGLTLTSGP